MSAYERKTENNLREILGTVLSIAFETFKGFWTLYKCFPVSTRKIIEQEKCWYGDIISASMSLSQGFLSMFLISGLTILDFHSHANTVSSASIYTRSADLYKETVQI